MSQVFYYPAPAAAAPVGGATAANQVLEIAQLTAINANTDGIESLLTDVRTNTGDTAVNTADIVTALAGTLAVTGPLTDTQLRASAVPVSAASLPLPSGAATEATLSTLNAKFGAIGQQLMAASAPVVIASDQSAVPVSGPLTDTQLRASAVPVSLASTTITGTVAATQSGTWNINNVSGTVSLPTGAATETTLAALNTKVTVVNTSAVTISSALPTGTNSIGQVTANAGTNLNTSALNLEATQSAMSAKLPATLGQKTSANSMAVTIASDQSTITVQEARGSTATLTNTSASASSVTVMASNASRLGGMFYNDSSSIAYLKFGSTASSTSFTVLLQAGAYYELPGPTVYSGIVTAIWASATGSMRATEVTA